jgi:PAS domain S-box-containing protein
MTAEKRAVKEILAENEELRLRLEEAEETLRAIGSGEVDAFVVSGPEGPQVFTVKGAEQPYRVMVETMNEGAATLTSDGTILYCNKSLAAMLQVPLESIVGTQLSSYMASVDIPLFAARLGNCSEECDKDEITMLTRARTPVPAMISCSALDLSGSRQVSLVVTDLTQKRRNEEIVASERLARSIIEQAGEAILVCDEGGRVIRASRLTHQLCGGNPLLKTFDELFQLRITETECLFSVLTPLHGGCFESVEVELKRGDGQVLHLLLNATPLMNDLNRIIGRVVSLTDITERKKAEAELLQSEVRLKAANMQLQAQSEEIRSNNEKLQDQNQILTKLWEQTRRTDETLRTTLEWLSLAQHAANIGTWSWEKSTEKITWSEELYGIFGLAPSAEASFETWLGVLHPDDRALAMENVDRSLTEQIFLDSVYRIIRPNGEIRWVNALGNSFYDDSGKPTRMCGICLDITERKETEESLRQAHQKLQTVIDSITDGLLVLDSNWRYTYFSEQGARLIGMRPEQIIGNYVWDQFPHAKDTKFYEGYHRAVESGQPVHFEEFYPEPLNKWLDCHCYPSDEGLSVYFHDITDRKQAEEALKKLNEELEKRVAERTAELREKDQILLLQSRQAAMGEMIGNIAHQWRQPLNVLGMTIQQLLLFYDLCEFNREFLEKNVLQSMELIRHMSKTIDDFRNYFRPDKEKVAFKVNGAIANTLFLIAESFKNQKIAIEVIAREDPVIFGYQNEFAQVLLNILNNARDILTERGIGDPRVTITVCSEGDRAVVTVADNGGGVPEEIMERIFDPYFTTKGPQRGTGVGLYMSKSIIEKNMGGRLTVRNSADGAEFRIEV